MKIKNRNLQGMFGLLVTVMFMLLAACSDKETQEEAVSLPTLAPLAVVPASPPSLDSENHLSGGTSSTLLPTAIEESVNGVVFTPVPTTATPLPIVNSVIEIEHFSPTIYSELPEGILQEITWSERGGGRRVFYWDVLWCML